MSKHVAPYLTAAVSLSLLLPPSYVVGTETPLREGPMMPPSTPTTPPRTGQQMGLPEDTTETNDKAGNIIQSSKDGPFAIESLLPKDATEEQKQFARGYFYGYVITIKDPVIAESLIKKYIDPSYGQDEDDDFSRTNRIGFFLGVEEAIKVRNLIFETLEAMGALKPISPVDGTSTPPSPPPPKRPTGPILP